MWLGAERQLLDTLHLGLANSLSWQKVLENEMWGPLPKMGRGGGEDKELLGVTCPVGSGDGDPPFPQGKSEGR